MRLGAVRVRSGKTCAGVYQRSLLLSTPGQPHSLVLRPCGGVSLCTRTGSTLAAMPKAAPHRWHSRSVEAASGPVSGRTAGGGTKVVKVCRTLQRHGVRCGTLVCPSGSPYCWYEIVKEHNRFGCTLIVIAPAPLFNSGVRTLPLYFVLISNIIH